MTDWAMVKLCDLGILICALVKRGCETRLGGLLFKGFGWVGSVMLAAVALAFTGAACKVMWMGFKFGWNFIK